MTTILYLPIDAAALAVGADEVAAALSQMARERGLDVRLVRTGSRGLFWLEPMLEVATPEGRIAYGPVGTGDIAGLLDAGLLEAGAHPLRLGAPQEIPYLRAQTRLTFARCGIIDPVSVGDYVAHGGYAGLAKALQLDATGIVDAVKRSGLRGRGGAGFPTGIKWNTVLLAEADQKYVVCNADEGDSGTFADRMLMEGDPLSLIEGMTIAGLAVGATRGFVYIRSEYPHAFATMNGAPSRPPRPPGILGPSVAGSGRAFVIEARLGAGAYICGEETALLESLEGKRGMVRAKPPLPAIKGPVRQADRSSTTCCRWRPCPASWRTARRAMPNSASGRSRGTLPFQLAGNVAACGGLVEVPFGLTLRQLLAAFGGGTRTGRPIRAVQVGGPLGAYFPDSLFDTPLDYEAFAAAKGLLGHGGIVVFDDTVDLAHQARFAFEFCAEESCGKCTPCRIGAVRGVETMDKILAGEAREQTLVLLDDLCRLMTDASLCAMGGLTPVPVLSALAHFPGRFRAGSRRAWRPNDRHDEPRSRNAAAKRKMSSWR